MSDNNWRGQTEEIRQYLQTLFGFSNHKYEVFDSDEPEALEIANLIYLKRAGRDMVDSDDFFSSPWYSCAYTGDIDSIGSEYVIFPGTEKDVLQSNKDKDLEAKKTKQSLIRLAEEITHGEHMAEHVPRIGSYDGFLNAYSEAYVEMVGNLGARAFANYLWQKDGKWIGIIIPEIEITLEPNGKKVIKSSSLDHYLGYSFAEQIMESGIPLFRNLFWAQNQKKGWKTLKKSIYPRIKLKRDIWIGGKPEFKRHFRKIGIKSKVLILG